MVTLRALDGEYAVCRLPAGEWPPAPAPGVYAVTSTADETSVVCLRDHAPAAAKTEPGWCAYMVEGPLDFALTGILASLTQPLAAAQIPVFAVSTYDTDYLLVRLVDRPRAEHAWRASHDISR